MSQIIDTKLLHNKYAVVTGCNRGIGRAICQNFLIQGASVIGCSREVNKQLQMEMASFGQNFHNIQLDVQDEISIKEALKAIKNITKEIDILVNNAAFARAEDRVPVVDMDDEIFKKVIDIKVIGGYLFAKAVAKILIAQDQGGQIINLSSTAGRQGSARTSAYNLSLIHI